MLLMVAGVGCGWNHAPGHDARHGMTKTAVPAIKPQLCLEGACNLAGPEGIIRVSILEASTRNERRDATAFDLEYVGTTAHCRGPAKGLDDSEVPFACSIEGPASNPSKRVLVLGPGCTNGTLRETEPAGSTEVLRLNTDVVRVARYRAPGREVSLSDDRSVRVFSDHQNPYDLLFFTEARSAPRAPELLAMVALHTFADLDGHPPQCLLPEP